MKKGIISHLYVLSGYTFLSLLMSYPLITKIHKAIPGNRGDDLQHLWNLWWVKKALVELGTSPYHTDYIFYPLGTSLAFHSLTLFNGLVSIPLQIIFNRIIVYNLLVLLSFILSGWGTYLLVNYLTKNKVASFLAGLVFAFSPYHSIHIQCGQLNLASVQFIPFFVLYLIKTFREKNLSASAQSLTTLSVWAGVRQNKNALLAGFFLFLSSLCSWYYAVYLVIFTVFFIIYNLIYERSEILNKRFIKCFILLLISFSFLIAPFIYPLLKEYFAGFTYMVTTDHTKLSADLVSFFIPYFGHPFFKNYVTSLYYKFTVDPYFLGYLVLILSIYAIFKVEFKKVRFWLFSCLFFGIMSLGPYLHILGKVYKNIPLPYLLMQNIPFFAFARSPNRLSIILYLSCAVLVGYGIHQLLSKRKSALKIFLSIFFAFVILWEFLSVPFKIPENMDIPHFYKKIGEEKENYAILEFPLKGNNYIKARYMYYQTMHNKKILNGYISRSSSTSRKFIEKGDTLLEDKDFLKEKRIKYILLHTAFLEENELEKLNNLLKDRFKLSNFSNQEIFVYEVY